MQNPFILKRHNLLLLLIVMIGFINPGYSQETSKAFTIIPEFPKPGESITISYDATNTSLKGKDSLKVNIYKYVDFKWKIEEHTLNKTGVNKWKTSVAMDSKSAFINCVFYSGDIIDNGGAMTYSWIINKVPGSYVAWGLMRNPNFNENFPQSLDPSSNIEDEVSLMWINNEIRDNPDSRKRIFFPGLKVMMLTKEGDHTARIKEEINYILELPLDAVQQYDVQRSLQLLDQSANKAFIDSVETVLLAKYPKGVLARDKEILRLFRESDIDKKISDFKTFQKEFPSAEFEDVYTDTEDLYYDKVYKAVSYTQMAKDKDFSYMYNNLENARFSALMEFSWHFIEIPFDRETMAIDSLNTVAGIVMKEIERRENRMPKEFKQKLSAEQWKNKAIERSAGGYLTYAKILEKVGDYEKVAYYLNKINPYFKEDSDFNELYTNHLVREGRQPEAVKYISESLKSNNATPKMISILKEDFIEKGGEEAGFDAYVNSLKVGESFTAQKEKLLSELMNEPIEGFDLEVMGGGNFRLEDQKGKIVIIDMWATWCAPCKKAMPGMEMAVNKYAKDENVQFVFLDTQEIIPNYREKVKEFIEENNYPFKVLFDSENPKTGKPDATYSKYAEAFQFSGIPQKMIIDQNGKLRWRSTGYMGSPSGLADELSIIIEYLKAEEKSK